MCCCFSFVSSPMATTQQHSNPFSNTPASRQQVLFFCAMFIYNYSFVVDGERKREAERVRSWSAVTANSFLVNSFFASLFFPHCTPPSDTAKVLTVHVCRRCLMPVKISLHISHTTTRLAHPERKGGVKGHGAVCSN